MAGDCRQHYDYAVTGKIPSGNSGSGSADKSAPRPKSQSATVRTSSKSTGSKKGG